MAYILSAFSIVAMLCFFSCITEKRALKEPLHDDRIYELRRVYNDKKEASAMLMAEDAAWIEVADCNGALWNGLAKAAGIAVDLSLVEASNGRIENSLAPGCDEGRHAGQTGLHNELAIGYLWGIWRSKDYKAAEGWASYLERNEFELLDLSVNNRALLGRVLFALSNGKDDRPYRKRFEFYHEIPTGMGAFALALELDLFSEVDTYLADLNLDRSIEGNLSAVDRANRAYDTIRGLSEASSEDALISASLGLYDGNMSPAIGLLLSDDYKAPDYVRGTDPKAFFEIHWMFTTRLILKQFEDAYANSK